MIVSIDTKKALKFINRHKGVLITAGLSYLLMREQIRTNRSLMDYIAEKGLEKDYFENY